MPFESIPIVRRKPSVEVVGDQIVLGIGDGLQRLAAIEVFTFDGRRVVLARGAKQVSPKRTGVIVSSHDALAGDGCGAPPGDAALVQACTHRAHC